MKFYLQILLSTDLGDPSDLSKRIRFVYLASGVWPSVGGTPLRSKS